jgi:hypothetical protein
MNISLSTTITCNNKANYSQFLNVPYSSILTFKELL